jgi:hypothetical protein
MFPIIERMFPKVKRTERIRGGLGGGTQPFGTIEVFLAVRQVAVGVVAEQGAGQLGEHVLELGVLFR